MLRRCITIAVCGLVALGVACADNLITVWDSSGTYNLRQDLATLEITSAGTFKVQATGDEQDGFGNINEITVASNVTGTVELTIRGESGGPGAWDVHVVNLSGNAITKIVELQVAHELAGDGKVVATSIDGAFYVLYNGEVPGNIAGDITVDSFNGQLHCLGMRNLTVNGVGPHSGNIEIDDDYSDAIFFFHSSETNVAIGGTLYGGIGVYGDWHTGTVVGGMGVGSELRVYGEMTGGLTIGPFGEAGYINVGSLAGSIWGGFGLTAVMDFGEITSGGSITAGQLDQEYDLAGSVTVETGVAGQITAWGDITAPVEIGGDLTGFVGAFGSIESAILIHGSVYGQASAGSLTGTLTIDGDMAGYIYAGELIDVAEDTTGGHIIIEGSLFDTSMEPPSIYIAAAFAGDPITEFITVDYHGWRLGHDWLGAVVHVGDDDLTENTPADRVWEISCTKGDVDNDNSITPFDIDPFVLALTDPGGYGVAFAGLSASRSFHGNCNCDNAFNAFDLDAFVLRLTDPCTYLSTYPGCDPCLECDGLRNDDETPAPTPVEVATLLAESVSPENYAGVVDLAQQLAADLPDAERAEFWAEILTELE